MGLDHFAESSSRAMEIQGNKICEGTISFQFVRISLKADDSVLLVISWNNL